MTVITKSRIIVIIKHPHFKATMLNQKHQFDLLYALYDVFQGKTYKCLLTGADVELRYKAVKALRSKYRLVAFVLKAIYKNDNLFKFPYVFKCDKGSVFKSNLKKLFENHNIDFRRGTKI